jgi:hypothetical protein
VIFKTTKSAVNYSKESRFGLERNMKKLFLVLTIILAMAAVSSIFGQSVKEVKLSADKQAVDSGSKLTFKLIEVKDTRCPADVNCVWSGNAIVKLSIAKGKSAAKMFELNTALDPKTISFQGYEISLKDLSPTIKSTDTDKVKYTAKLTLTKMPKSK